VLVVVVVVVVRESRLTPHLKYRQPDMEKMVVVVVVVVVVVW